MTPETLREILASHAVVLATRLADGNQMLLPNHPAPQALQDAATLALSRDESRCVEIAGETWFLQVYAPPCRLLVVGAVHIAQALAPLAQALGYAVTVVDPRRGFASADRFAGITLSHAWPDEAIAAFAPDARSAVVTLTHDPKLDDPALAGALGSHAFFIGALGSRRTHAARLKRLRELGHRSAAASEALQDATSRRVGEGREDRVERG